MYIISEFRKFCIVVLMSKFFIFAFFGRELSTSVYSDKLTAVEDSYKLLFRYYPVDCDNVVTYVQYKKYDCTHVQECNVQKSCLLSPKGIGGNKFC